jgi:hypothetical protein
MKYRIQNEFVITTDSGLSIPVDLSNADYNEFLAWLANGNTPEPLVISSQVSHTASLADRLAEAEKLIVELLEKVTKFESA